MAAGATLHAGAAAFQAVSSGLFRDNPGRFAFALLGIVLGVALGVAVHLINASALDEFNLAVRSLSGEADLVIRGPRSGFDESVYPRIAKLSQILAASPAIDADVRPAGRKETLRVIGIDPFRAAQVQPAAVQSESVEASAEAIRSILDPYSVRLSHSAAQWLGLKAGDKLRLGAGASAIELTVTGLLPPGAFRQRIAIMDIASAQWHLQRLGRINRIDVRVRPGTDIDALRVTIAAMLPAGVVAATPESESAQSAELSRSYRLNLDMLALVALLTGSYLVFSTQVLAILRRRSQLALARVLGLTRRALCAVLIAEGALMGMLGSGLGVALGCALAAGVLQHLGGDLGAGYFRTVSPELRIAPAALAAYWLLGTAFAVIGAAIPAFEAGRRAPAQALRAGDEEEALPKLRTGLAGLALIATGLALTPAPAWDGLPVFGYAAIALLLLGTLLLMPRLAQLALSRLPAWHFTPAMLAAAQLQATPRQVAISIGAIVTSLSLMAAMLTMVGSFRQSLDEWLTGILPADMVARSAQRGDAGRFTPEQQARIAATPGVQSTRFARSRDLLLRADRPAVTLLARTIDREAAHRTLPLIGPALTPGSGAPPPAWITEVASDLHQLRVGDLLLLPIEGRQAIFTVAGIWRDYARQNGAIVIEREIYMRISGDRLASEAALVLSAGSAPREVAEILRERLGADAPLQIATTRELRDESMSIFDRTFAVTYALEIVAVLIGLFGVSVSFGAQALARRREFGMLRHIGMSRREIAAMLACEGAIVAVLGALIGLALGLVQSLVLVHVVNRQSFHWSIDMHVPWLSLAALASILVATASLTAAWSARRAMSGDAVRAVREDW